MITGELRNKIDRIWETFWTGGITNPLDVIEQFTYLLFIKQLDEVETIRENEANFLGVPFESRFVEMFGDPQENQNQYEKKKLKDTCMVVTGNTPSRAIDEYYGNYIEWIKTDNIVSGLLNPTTAVEYLSQKGMSVGRTVEKNSILMV